MPETKICSRCNETKPLDRFHKNGSRKDGLADWCKSCANADQRERRAENPDKMRAYDCARREKRKDLHLQQTYGITLAEYDEVLEAQGDCCAICGKTITEQGRRLCIDHNHETGENRGLLCTNCNIGIGFLQDSSEVCRQAMLYLRRYRK